LLGKLTLHIDDEGAGGEPPVLDELIAGMTERFGELKIQKNDFRHIGHDHSQTWAPNGTCTIVEGQEFYTKTLNPITVPPGPRTAPLTPSQYGDLRILNGEMGYAKDSRPDAMGRIAFSQQNVDKDACVQHLVEANEALKVLQDPNVTKTISYEPLQLDKLKLIAIADGAIRKKNSKYSQGCYYILLVEVLEGHTGGRCHVLQFKSNRATRVSKSSMSAEVLVLVRAAEALTRVAAWLSEIWYGADDARSLIGVKNPVPCQLVTDAFDVFQTLQCSRPYTGADESLAVYLESLREDLLQGRVDEFAWIPTLSMLADGGSKPMADILAQALLRDRFWYPSEYKILLRENMDGAASIDRIRDLDEDDKESGEPLWESDGTTDAFAWFYGCVGIERVAQGCMGSCPWCTQSHYQTERDRVPDVYWVDSDGDEDLDDA
jgi:hypothetical protein